MYKNKATVEQYMEGFRRRDHAMILDCLTDDVVWDIPGFFHIQGKAAFDCHIEDDSAAGPPAITVTRLTEENSVVIAEGSVKAARKAGTALNLEFCDVFEMRDGKISRLVSYLVMLK